MKSEPEKLQVLETVPGIALLGPNGGWQYFDEKFCEILGVPRECLDKERPDAVLPGRLMSALVSDTLPETGGRTVQVFEFPLAGEVGADKWVRLAAVPRLNEREEAGHWMLLLEDRTSLRQVELALKECEGKLNLILTVSNEGFWEWFPATDVLIWSDTVYEILGLKAGEIKLNFDAFLERVYPEDRPIIWRAVEAAFSGNEKFDLIFRIQHASGDYQYVHSRGEAQMDAHGTPVRMMGIVSDITARMESEPMLAHALGR